MSQRGGGGGWVGVQFSKRLDFGVSILKMQENVRGVEILRHRTGLLCKSCQSTFMFLSKVDNKIRFCWFFVSNKMLYPFKAWPRNLSAISPIRNVVSMYTHTPMHTAKIWKNI